MLKQSETSWITKNEVADLDKSSCNEGEFMFEERYADKNACEDNTDEGV